MNPGTAPQNDIRITAQGALPEGFRVLGEPGARLERVPLAERGW